MKFNAPIIKSSPRFIYTMRHFESEGNARGLDDNSLAEKPNHLFAITEKGLRQKAQSKSYMDRNDMINSYTDFYTSEFLRTQQSMEGVLGRYEIEVIADSRLDEWWKGIFHSLSKEEIEKYYPNEKKVLQREGWHHYRPPQGQAGKDVEINLLSFLSSLTQRHVFIVGHGRNLGFLRRLLTNQPTDFNCDYPIPENGEIWEFRKSDKYYNFKSLFVPKTD